MPQVKCYWAGRLIVIPDLDSELSVSEKLEETEKRLKQKQIKLDACGTEFLITELCVDVMDNGNLVAMHNFKA